MRYTFPSFLLAAAILAVAFESASYIQSGSGAAYVTYEQAQPILKALEQVLPAELRHTNQRDAPSMWAKWVVHHDAQIRDRLAQGYEDSLTNFLLFGTYFTDGPRVTLAVLAQLANKPLQTTPNSFETGGVFELINARANDLVRAVASSSATSQLRDRTSAPVAEGPRAYRTLERSPSRDHRTRTRFHRQGRRIRFTIQPFAIIDSLVRTGLARTADLRVTTLDLSPRVNDHLRRAGDRARRGEGYTLQLPRDANVRWNPDAIDYWLRFGDRIASPVSPVAPARHR